MQRLGVGYVNYPLTGGPLGAQLGGGHPNGMLILASGDQDIYGRLEPTLEVLGRPRNYGASVSAGAETKLIGQHLVFNGCTGICTGAALYAECFADGAMGGEGQGAYFDFLNGGAGGTRQWDVALSKGVKDDDWGTGFSIRHAVVDAIYAAKLAQEKGPVAAVHPADDQHYPGVFLYPGPLPRPVPGHPRHRPGDDRQRRRRPGRLHDRPTALLPPTLIRVSPVASTRCRRRCSRPYS